MKRLFTLAAVLCATLAFGAQQTINIGTAPRGTGGDDNRAAWTKGNANFTELYTSVADLTESLTLLQPIDTDLTAIAAVGTTPFGRSLLALADAAAGRTAFGLENVENTALSTWAGSTNLTTLGTISAGTWNGSIIGPTYLGTGSSIGTKYLRGDGTWQTVTTDTSTLQPLDADLTSIAALTTTSFGRTLLTLGTADSLRVLTTSYTALGAGTDLAVGTNYTASLSADRTLTFSGTPVNGSKISLAFTASTASTLTFPESYRQGDTASITSLAFAIGNHTLSWTYDGSRWNLVDTADDTAAANLVMASPDGSSGVLTPRKIVGDDIMAATIGEAQLDLGTGEGQLSAGTFSIEDAGGLYTATSIEGALAEARTAINNFEASAFAYSPVGPFWSSDIGVDLADAQLSHGGGAGITSGIRMPAAGTIRAVSGETSEDITAGEVTLTVYLNGVATDVFTWIGDAEDKTNYGAPETGTVFAANDLIDVRIATDTITPAGTSEVSALAWVEFSEAVAPRGPPDVATLPLDEVPGAAGAWSVARKLDADYAGDAFKVSRLSDGTTAEIGFDPATGLVDEAELETFCAGTNGYVHTIYDQSGNARNMTNASSSGWPLIVDAGVAIKDSAGRIAFHQSGVHLLAAARTASLPITDFLVVANNSLTISDIITSGGSNVRAVLRQRSASTWGLNNGSVYDAPTHTWIAGTRYLVTTQFATGTDSIRINDGTPDTGTAGDTTITSYRFGDGSLAADCFISERIVYESALSSDDQATLRANFNAFYGLY